MVSVCGFLTTGRGDIKTVLNAVVMVAKGYRARVGKVMEKVKVGSPLYELMRQVIDRAEPHFADRGTFNTAFVGRAAAVVNCFATNKAVVRNADKWRILRMGLLSLCLDAGTTSGEGLAWASKRKAETWLSPVGARSENELNGRLLHCPEQGSRMVQNVW